VGDMSCADGARGLKNTFEPEVFRRVEEPKDFCLLPPHKAHQTHRNGNN